MKKIIYSIIRYPLILIFLKTPLIKILKKRFSFQRSLKNRSYIMFVLDTFFEREYICKINNRDELRQLITSTVKYGQGEKWASHYYDNPIKDFETLKKQKVGLITAYEANPIYKKITEFIKSNNLHENENTYLIQLGSSSGRDLEFLFNYFPKLNFISTDIEDEILNFQKDKYKDKNFKFFKCYAEEIDKCINYFKLKNKKIIIFSIGSLQYVVPFYLKDFFSKIGKFNNINLFINEPVDLRFINLNKDLSSYRGKTSFSHMYSKYAEKFEIIEEKVIRPYSKEDKNHKYTGQYYLHIKS